MNAIAENEPKLDRPGAGLPKAELFIARALFSWRLTTGNRESFGERFAREREAILRLIGSCSEESGARRVLIRRPRGLEDSSRYWSVWMTLDHLRIVNNGCARIIESLTKGAVPGGTSSTAAVKPSPEADAKVIPAYERSCDQVMNVVGVTVELKTSLRYAHPWFGPLNAAGWHALAGGHMGLHRGQIERILEGLSAAGT